MPRGKKICPECSTINGCRQINCIKCNAKIGVEKEKKFLEVNWKKLQVGDYIKVFKKSGPYFTTKENTKIYMGNYGNFEVKRLLDNGIVGWPLDSRYQSEVFIYMGKPKLSDTGVMRTPHKIAKISDLYRQSRR